jgi:uncharacterized protein
MVQVTVRGIALDARMQPVVLLRPLGAAVSPPRVLPIWIGAQEAASISLALEGGAPPRPLSHDLMQSLVDALGARLDRVDVTRLDAGTFYAELTLVTPTGRRVVDSRPSDAIALALRTDAPIWVDDAVLDEAGVLDDSGGTDDDEDDDDADADGRDRAPAPADAEAELKRFRSFLDDVAPEDFQG